MIPTMKLSSLERVTFLNNQLKSIRYAIGLLDNFHNGVLMVGGITYKISPVYAKRELYEQADTITAELKQLGITDLSYFRPQSSQESPQ